MRAGGIRGGGVVGWLGNRQQQFCCRRWRRRRRCRRCQCWSARNENNAVGSHSAASFDGRKCTRRMPPTDAAVAAADSEHVFLVSCGARVASGEFILVKIPPADIDGNDGGDGERKSI